eukprot:TRINITY_DN6855_c0_g4_i1.p1 TRINITY_DN6855_c0_g4~~TRINITY_DN6855_c0_g4_i1.p1  ORF type:complete len:414 (+),score=59.69 TRINITY_DN6855_c0_g4_i1:474-1715(+)
MTYTSQMARSTEPNEYPDIQKARFHHNYVESEDDVPQEIRAPLLIQPMSGYRVELGGSPTTPEMYLEEQDVYAYHYHNNFTNHPHINFIGGDKENPIIVSIQTAPDSTIEVKGSRGSGSSKALMGYRVIVRTKKADHHSILPLEKSRTALLQSLKIHLPFLQTENLKQISNSVFPNDLAYLERRMYLGKHKFGVVYCRAGQTTEEEMFSNENGSELFYNFMDMMGDRIQLRGWPDSKYSGGLDTKNDSTGKESYYTEYEGLSIMYHVSTLLPLSKSNSQQVERKRHIGNDVCCIIFQDPQCTPFRPDTIASKFNHVYIVVQVLPERRNGKICYQMAVVSKQGVWPHSPVLPEQGTIFEHGPQFRDFLLTKIINSERAASHAPAFCVTRTRKQWLTDLVEKYQAESPSLFGCFG